MNAIVYSHEKIIGHADLKVGDESMGHVYGTFVENSNYQTIQNFIQKFNSNIERDYARWSSLKLSVQLENGCFLFPVGGIQIGDWVEFSHEPKSIDIAGVDSEIITDYFKANPSRSFVREPWITLDIDRKLAIEEELRKEIGNRESSGKVISKHVLLDYEYSALCATLQCDDVLFSVYSRDSHNWNYASVHLTWANHKESNPNFPSTIFFKSFKEFREKRMNPDNIEFEL